MNSKKISSIVILCCMMTALGAQNTIDKNNNTLAKETASADEEVKFRGWRQAETEHFRFIFEDASRMATEVYAQYADEAWNKIAKLYAIPQNKTDVYVTARTNTVNAFTFFVPPEIMMFTSPLITPEFGFRDNWQKLFFTHELVHIANIQFEDKNYFSSKLFGPMMHNFDMTNIPGWALEGLTTVLETELTSGGRGRSPFFELMYKAPTLDNGFISYAEIGTEQEPPYGQSYVMGYLIMRSIADRWGIQALADIERNRSGGVSWEQSVRLVTGENAEDIYKDVRIALAKKYASERSIPEGIIITPRDVGTFYYKPAVIADDGTIITLRSSNKEDSAVVRFDPSGREGSGYIEDSFPQKDLNTVMKETILFTGDFSDMTAVTASADGTVYASLAIQRADRNPGIEVEYALYKWTKDYGLTRLTKNTSLFSPTVSRDGKTLVAVQQHGLKMRLVAVDTQSGAVTPLLQNDSLDFIEPALNADGSKLAFLVLDDSRAAVAFSKVVTSSEGTLLLSKDESVPTIGMTGNSYTVVANGYGNIVDPAFPSWNSDGALTYACNTRGRLEVFEVDVQNNVYVSTPKVADPIGAIWTYKTDRGVYYESYASTGYVLKMKPLAEWGVVPEKKGPSPAGEVMQFGSLEVDYPYFKPYRNESEIEIGTKSKDEYEDVKTSKTPIPVRGKTVEHRSQKNINLVGTFDTTQKTLQNERTYISMPKPVMYYPAINCIVSGEDKDDWNVGYGYNIIWMTPKLQLQSGVGIFSGYYYPKLNNCSAMTGWIVPVGSSDVEFVLSHSLNNYFLADKNYYYGEDNYVLLGGSIPVYHRAQHVNELDFSLLYKGFANYSRNSNESISFDSDVPYSLSLSALLGFELSNTKQHKKNYFSRMNVTALGQVNWSQTYSDNVFYGFEGETEYEYGNDGWRMDFELRGRYADYPYATAMPYSRAHPSGKNLDCSYPGRLVGRAGYVMPNSFLNLLDLELFAEGLVSFGKNTVDYETPESGYVLNMTPDKIITFGLEANEKQNRTMLAFGYTWNIDVEDFNLSSNNFYFSVKLNWIRH